MKKYIFSLFVFLSTLYLTQINAQTNTPPNWNWATNIQDIGGGTSGAFISSYTDLDGNTYVLNQLNSHIKIAKYNAVGSLVWSRVGSSGTGTVAPEDIAVDALGNYYVTGSMSTAGTVNFGTISLTGNAFFVVKYNASGNVLWAKNTVNTNYEGKSLAIDGFGNVLVVRNYYQGSNKNWYSQIVKFNSIGEEQWVKSYSSNLSESISLDDFGNAYLTGRSYSSSNAFVRKLDPFGNPVWYKSRSDNSYGKDIVTDKVGNSYVTGYFYVSNQGKNAFVTKYDAAGNVVWEQQGVGEGNNSGEGIALDKNGNCYVTGAFQQEVTIGPIVLSNVNSGVGDVFVTKFDNLGDVVWAQQTGESGTDAGLDIGVDTSGNCYVNGYYTLRATFGSTTILGNGQYFPFLAKIGDATGSNLGIATLPLASHNFTAGGAVSVPFATEGVFPSGTIFKVELSNSTGSFFNPTEIGVSTTSPINCVLPSLTIPGSGYRVRVVTETPVVFGTDNGSALTINANNQLITPAWAWATNIKDVGGSSSDASISSYTDSDGNTYVLNRVNSHIKIAKYNAVGSLVWSRVGSSGTGTVAPEDIAVDALGNYYVTGSMSTAGTVNFGTISLTGNAFFVVKYNASGNVLWAKNTVNTNYEGKSLAIDGFGNVLVVRNYYQGSNKNWYSQIVKFNSIGEEQWVKSYSSNLSESISLDDFGNAYLTGRSYSSSNAFVRKLDPFGNQVWYKSRSDNSYGKDIVTDKNGNSYVTGYAYVSNQGANVFVTKYDAAGNVLWEQQGVGSDAEYGYGVALDKNGNCYVTGAFQHNTDFSTLNVSNSNSGVSDVFVTKYDADGNVIWIQQAGETGRDAGLDIGVDDSGNCYINGYFTSKIALGNTLLNGDGEYVPFLAKIGESATTTLVGNVIVKGENFCGGAVVIVNFAISGKYEDDNVFTAQLSDKEGSFSNPLDIGTLKSPQNTSIYAIIPLNTIEGDKYRIRVTSSNKALVGLPNEIDIQINKENCNSNTNELITKSIEAVEYFIDTDPGVGNGTPLQITSGLTIDEEFGITIPSLDEGFHSLFLRTKDEDGVWSMYDGRVFYIQPKASVLTTSPVVKGEYFFDTEPGIGKGTTLTSFSSSNSVELTNEVATTGLSEGFHSLFIRTKNEQGVWSMYEGRVLYVQPSKISNEIEPIVAAEYYFNSDPGVGGGIEINSGAPQNSISITVNDIETSNLEKGEHSIFVRVKNNKGIWSLAENRDFTVCSDVLNAPVVESNTVFCYGEKITLEANDVLNATGYKWTGPNNFTANTQNITINNSTDANAGEYVVIAINDLADCKEGNATKISVTINATDAPKGETVQMFESGKTIADIVVEGTDVKWFNTASDAKNGTNVLVSTTELVNSKTYYATQTLNGCASKTSLEVTISITLGIDSLNKTNFMFYPNPTSNELNIKIPNHLHLDLINVYDLTGKLIFNQKESLHKVNVHKLSSGIYVLEAVSGTVKVKKRFIKI